MKAISHRQHRLLTTTLQEVERLLQGELVNGLNEKVEALSRLYHRYETLLSDLAECIAQYEALQREVKVNVVAPALRQARKTAKSQRIKIEIQRESILLAY